MSRHFEASDEATSLVDNLRDHMARHGWATQDVNLVLAEALIEAFWTIKDWTDYLPEPAAQMEQLLEDQLEGTDA